MDDEQTVGDDLSEALKMGLQRAGLHWLRAGYEVVAGVGALLDELVRVRSTAGEDSDAGGDLATPTHIEIE